MQKGYLNRYPFVFFVKFVNYIEAKDFDAYCRANALESCLFVSELILPIAKKFVNDNIQRYTFY